MEQQESGYSQPSSTGIVHRISLSSTALRLMVDADERLGAAYGATYEQIIAEDTINGQQVQVYLRQDVQSWTLIVRGALPLDTIVSLHAAPYSRHAPFTAEGEVLFSEIPEAWLRLNIDLVVVLPAADST